MFFHMIKKLKLLGKVTLKGFLATPTDSLADFYNYSFSLARCEYLMKWDAHAIMFERTVDKIQSIIIKK